MPLTPFAYAPKPNSTTRKMFPPPVAATATTSSSSRDNYEEDAWASEVMGTIARARAHLDQKQQEAADRRTRQKTTPKLKVVSQAEDSGEALEKEPNLTTATLQSSASPRTTTIPSTTLPQRPTPQPQHSQALATTPPPSLPPSPPSFLLSPLDSRRQVGNLLPTALPPPLPLKRLLSLSQLPH